MALTPGARLGSYEILSTLGKGGMGEVWRARDSKLGREVAIKTLPEEFARDEERLARFEREAKLLASLNHPNIATIHGLEEDNGIRFLVLELVEGETLADAVKRDAIAVEESLKLALQIAEALEAAHEKGVIHRDLKPLNIKVTPDGKVKVLDFGLAKALAGDGTEAGLSQSPTISMTATQQGVILGTAAYMAPEQARGGDVDKRADVWAFGCVLYEMLTGRQTWSGPTVTDMIAAAVAKDPDFTILPSNLNPRIQELLRRCLEKEPKNRWQAVGDVRVEVEQLLGDPDGLLVVPTSDSAPTRSRPSLPWIAATFMLTAVATGIAAWSLQPDLSPPAVVRFSHTLADGQAFPSGGSRMIDVSREGSRIAYVANGQLWLRDIGSEEARPIPGTQENPLRPVFSPNGEWIAYGTNNQLKKIQIAGGSPVALCDATPALGRDWFDDTIYFGQGNSIMGVSSNGGTPRVVVEDGGGPHMLPGGRVLVFNRASADATSGIQIWAQVLETGEQTLILEDGRMRGYAPTGHLIYYVASTIFAVAFDAQDLKVLGGPVPVIESASVRNFHLSDTGTAVYLSGGTAALSGDLVWIDREGNEEALTTEPGNYDMPTLSPNRSTVAYFDYGSAAPNIWTYNIDTGISSQETFSPQRDFRPVWSPKGDRLAFTSEMGGNGFDLYFKSIDPRGDPEPLISRPGEQFPDSWSPDGRTIAFHEYEQGVSGSQDIYTLSLEDTEVTPYLTTTADERGPMFSPTGDWIAYVSDEQGSTEVYLMPFPADPGRKRRISYSGGSEPRWNADGSELFYRDNTSMVAVEIGPDGQPRGTQELFPDAYRRGPFGNVTDYDIDVEGSRFLMLKNSATASGRIHVILNWFQELKERVPVP